MARTYSGPVPKPTPETQPFWEAARRHVLMVQRCTQCRQFFFYPRPLCPQCLSRNVEWVAVSGRGRLHTFTINYRPSRHFPGAEPIVIGIVELDEGPRLLSTIVGLPPDPAQIRCDTPLEVVFEDLTAEISLPKFRPRGA